MFHVKHELWQRVTSTGGRRLNPNQIERLARFQEWLVTEAVPAGGLGPNEVDRVARRHVADSLLFASVLEGSPEHIRDLGSGVGLPGIPLAILLPESRVELVDRSGRRTDLIKRAVRVLGLPNVDVIQRRADQLEEPTTVFGVACHANSGGDKVVGGFSCSTRGFGCVRGLLERGASR